jgi:uncharacterized protein with HEPN domain
MSKGSLRDDLNSMRQSAIDACSFVKNLSKEEFLRDKRTQQAVVMSLVIIGEAAGRIMNRRPQFALRHQVVPWRSMRGMRNRIAHGYFDIDLEIVWDTVQGALPTLLDQLAALPTNDEVGDERKD